LAAKEEKGVYARYVSVETIREIGNGKVEWRYLSLAFLLNQRSVES
jgi:hypothetical protein